jgi:hypothetical protein
MHEVARALPALRPPPRRQRPVGRGEGPTVPVTRESLLS